MTTPYHAAKAAAGWIDRSDRIRLAVTGPDRVRFLHNLTTQDVKRLANGQGGEAFVTSPQGKTLAFVTLLADDDRIVVRSDSAAGATLLPHFAKYGVLDDVAVTDVGPETFEIHVAGPEAEAVVGHLGLELPLSGELNHISAMISGRPLRLVREAPAGLPGLTLIGDRPDAETVKERLQEAGRARGLVELDREAFEALRIEAGTPVFGQDATPESLPQELRRDAQAISFTKGCYLGQETVARLDAMGHVNKVLVGARVEGGSPRDVPPPGSALEADGKKVGTVTSSVFSPGWDRPVVLAIVRVTHATAGTELALDVGGERRAAVVCDLPMVPPDA